MSRAPAPPGLACRIDPGDSEDVRVVVAALAAAILGLTANAAVATPLPGAPACPVLPADNVWNRRVDALPVLPGSDALVRSIGTGSSLHPDFSDAGRYGIPIN